jgi:molybdopterin/thiamine biosynthesis adenylyltransferase
MDPDRARRGGASARLKYRPAPSRRATHEASETRTREVPLVPEEVASRHSDDLGGKLTKLDPSRSISVLIEIDPNDVGLPCSQHTAWMLVNLMARAEKVVDNIFIQCPTDAAVLSKVIPFGSSTQLNERLIEAGRSIGVAAVNAHGGEEVDWVVTVGRVPTSTAHEHRVLCFGAGWWGGVNFDLELSDGPHWDSADISSPLPFGPYMAACFAAAHLFLTVRDARMIVGNKATHYGWDCWAQRVALEPTTGPILPLELNLDGIGVAGVGAVGTAWMHTMWAIPGTSGSVVLADADEQGVTLTNLNRGVLFTANDLKKPKAEVAADAAQCEVQWRPTQERFQDSGFRPELLISCVDTNRSREALQDLYPARILGGSTHDLRAEVLHAGPAGIGACLRCYNKPEIQVSDEVLRAKALDPSTSTSIARVAGELDLPLSDAIARLSEPACDMTSERLMRRLREVLDDSEVAPRFAVGFTSVAAGTLLAAETIIELLPAIEGRPLPRLDNSITVQFWRPASSVNGRSVLGRDSNCPKCTSGIVATRMWANRQSGFAWSLAKRGGR